MSPVWFIDMEAWPPLGTNIYTLSQPNMPLPIPKSIPKEPGVIPTGGAYRKLQDFLSVVHQVQEIAIDDDNFKKGLVSAFHCNQKKSIVLDIDRSGISQYLGAFRLPMGQPTPQQHY